MANTTNIPLASEQRYLPTVSVDGIGSLGNFDKFSGGDQQAKISKYLAGGQGSYISYDSIPEFTDVTVTRVYEEARDNGVIASLIPLVGTVGCTISVQMLDIDLNPVGTPRVYQGLLASVKPGNTDSTSSAPRMWELSSTVDSVAN